MKTQNDPREYKKNITSIIDIFLLRKGTPCVNLIVNRGPSYITYCLQDDMTLFLDTILFHLQILHAWFAFIIVLPCRCRMVSNKRNPSVVGVLPAYRCAGSDQHNGHLGSRICFRKHWKTHCLPKFCWALNQRYQVNNFAFHWPLGCRFAASGRTTGV